MAANYSQYTDHNEIGGVSVGLEDAKLAAADSVDEVASTDCVLMKDSSGNPVKILKEDFNEAVRDALGSILSLNPLGTAIGKVAALSSSDNDFGSISTSDLASVLGATFKFRRLSDIVVQPNTPTKIMNANGQAIYFIIGRDWGQIGMFGAKYNGTTGEISITTIFKNCIYNNFELTQTVESGVCITSDSGNTYYVIVFG